MVQELESTPSWVTLGNHFASHVPHWLKSCDCFPKCRKKAPKQQWWVSKQDLGRPAPLGLTFPWACKPGSSHPIHLRRTRRHLLGLLG